MDPDCRCVLFLYFGLEMYDKFIQLLRRLSPPEAGKLPHEKDAIASSKSVETFTRALRNIFEKNPSNRMAGGIKECLGKFSVSSTLGPVRVRRFLP
ncbi:MAG: hypothetical protein ACE5JO_09825 [Candidatus Binatia bacterium]